MEKISNITEVCQTYKMTDSCSEARRRKQRETEDRLKLPNTVC